MAEAGEPPGARRHPERAGAGRVGRIALRVLAILALVVLVVWANLYAAEHDLLRESARRFGYPGVLAAAALSGFNLMVPVPVIAFFPFLVESGFAPVPTVAVIAAGMTIGDAVGYLIGHTARRVFTPRERGVIARLERLRDRHPIVPLLVMFLYAAFAPLPNEVLVLPLAFLRYPVAGILLAVLAGNLIFNGLVAFGIVRVFETI